MSQILALHPLMVCPIHLEMFEQVVTGKCKPMCYLLTATGNVEKCQSCEEIIKNHHK